MGDFQGPFIVSPPPSLSSSDKSSTTMLYYGLVVVGIAAMALALYNFIIIKRSRRRHMQSQAEGANGLVEVAMESSRIENCQRNNFNMLSSFKYKKEGIGNDGDYDYECPVCLSGFEEGEEVRKLPRCKHWFHAPCIDMWLYSHLDCPICRTPVGQFCHRFHSGLGLLESSGGGGGGGGVSVV
ncbi:RING-H2 finger protein ATL54 [Glycine soja]|nr:RING-H2 finger protein ATL54 [Glycine soja]